MVEEKAREAQGLQGQLQQAGAALQAARAQAGAEVARGEARHREAASRAAAEAAAARRAADGRMQGLAAEQLRALEETEASRDMGGRCGGEIGERY